MNKKPNKAPEPTPGIGHAVAGPRGQMKRAENKKTFLAVVDLAAGPTTTGCKQFE
jgi:hypothetical protein